MQVETTVGILDQYLLTGQASVQDVKDCLARHAAMPYLRHLELSGLVEGLPDDAAEATRRLLRLRLLFADHHMNTDDVLLNQLLCFCLVYHSLQAYIRNDISRRELEQKVSSAAKSDDAGPVLQQIIYDLRLTVAEDPQEVDRVDVVNICFKTMRRLEALWSAILG